MGHLTLVVFTLCLVSCNAGERFKNQKDHLGDPTWCAGYESYCSFDTIKSQCKKMCKVTVDVDPSWCSHYKLMCKDNPSIRQQCPHTCAQAVHGDWGEWSDWDMCTVSCGQGVQKRQRSCDHPAPKNGGKECAMKGGNGMKEIEIKNCMANKCPINGGYGDWSKYSKCSKICGGGLQYRNRCCINPFPSNGGDDCSELGPSVEAQVCNTMPCPINGSYGEWSDWGQCSKKCGGGIKLMNRKCDKPSPRFGGKDCSELGKPIMSHACNEQPCPIDGGYTDWTPYSKCTKTCGGGLQYKSRCCVNPAPAFGGKPCILTGEPVDIKSCGTDACPINGNWGKWEGFGACSKTCGDDGIHLRRRTCDNPPAMFGGKDCPGPAIESAACNRSPCAVNGGLSQWSAWTSCSATCGAAIRTRSRTCTNPPPANGGSNCVGNLNDVTNCNLAKCIEYKYGLDLSTWDNAETTCVAWGGHLASVVDQAEMDKIIKGFAASGVAMSSDVYIWIGLQDRNSPSEWSWIDGSKPAGFTPWGNGEPSHTDHHCVSMNMMTKTWWDRNCPTLYRYVCKK